MKMNILAFTLLLLLSTSNLQSSNTIKKKIQITVGGLNTKTRSDINDLEKSVLANITSSYLVNKYFDIGVYVSCGKLQHIIELEYNPETGNYEWYSADGNSWISVSGGTSYQNSTALNYGLKSEIHVLPFLIKKEIKFDLYVNSQAGLLSEKYTAFRDYAETIWSKPFTEYGLGIGLKYNFTRKFGIYSDFTLGRFYNNDRNRLKFGLSFTL